MDVMGERKRIIIIDITAEYLLKLEFLKLYWLDSWLEVISIVELRRLWLQSRQKYANVSILYVFTSNICILLIKLIHKFFLMKSHSLSKGTKIGCVYEMISLWLIWVFFSVMKTKMWKHVLLTNCWFRFYLLIILQSLHIWYCQKSMLWWHNSSN